MVIWPWSTIRELRARNNRQRISLEDMGKTIDVLDDRAALMDKDLALAQQALRTSERDLERTLAELHLVQQDFRHLVATATRLPSKSQPLDFSRDPFEEDPKIPEIWLTENGELPDVGAIEEILSGQSEAGEPRGSGSS
jgi:hypothetical protein